MNIHGNGQLRYPLTTTEQEKLDEVWEFIDSLNWSQSGNIEDYEAHLKEVFLDLTILRYVEYESVIEKMWWSLRWHMYPHFMQKDGDKDIDYFEEVDTLENITFSDSTDNLLGDILSSRSLYEKVISDPQLILSFDGSEFSEWNCDSDNFVYLFPNIDLIDYSNLDSMESRITQLEEWDEDEALDMYPHLEHFWFDGEEEEEYENYDDDEEDEL